MEQIFKNDFINIKHDGESTVISQWHPKTEFMEDDEFKESHMGIVHAVVETKSHAILGYTQDFAYTIVPEIQEWVANDTFPALIEAGLKKIAMIVSTDFFSQISIQQSMEEVQEDAPVVTKYFNNADDAKAWIDAE